MYKSENGKSAPGGIKVGRPFFNPLFLRVQVRGGPELYPRVQWGQSCTLGYKSEGGLSEVYTRNRNPVTGLCHSPMVAWEGREWLQES